MISQLAPILLFVYNRPAHTRRTLEALAQNRLADESELYIYSDGPKKGADASQLAKIHEVKRIIRERQWCKTVTVIEAPANKGLAGSVIAGVTDQLNAYGKAIVLEDDLVTARGFLQYMNRALETFAGDSRVMQVSGHQFPIHIPARKRSFFLPLTTSWGWATWKRAWDQFDVAATGYEKLKSDRQLRHKFDLDNCYPYAKMLINQMEKGTISSWAIRWWWSVFLADGISLYPDKSLIKNIGFDQEASHTKSSNPFEINNFDEHYAITDFPRRIEPSMGHMKMVQKLLLRGSLNSKNPMVLMAKLLKRKLWTSW